MTYEELDKEFDKFLKSMRDGDPYAKWPRKKRLELASIRPILIACNIPESNVICFKEDGKEQEEPDFIIKDFEGKRVGVEVVNCVASLKHGNNHVRVQSDIETAIKEYENRLKKSGEHHIHVTLDLASGIYSTNQKQAEFIESFIAEIENHRQGKTSQQIYVEKVTCFEHKALHTCVICPFFYMTRPITKDDFASWIDKKENKLKNYREKNDNKDIDEYWLVIHAPSAELLSVEDYHQEAPIISQYTRIYLTAFFDECARIL